MKKILIIFFAMVSVSFANLQKEVEKICIDLSSEYQQKSGDFYFKKKLAVFDFKNNSKELAKYNAGTTIANIFRVKLNESTIFTLVEREELKKILKELELGQTGLVDAKSAPKAGELLGAELLLMGTVSELGDRIIVDVKLIDTATSEIKSAKSLTLSREEVLNNAKIELWNSFQSKYGLSITGAVQTIILQNSSLHNPVFNGGGFDIGYKLNKYFNIGLGYFAITGTEFVREKIPLTIQSNVYQGIMRNYNFKGQGPKIFADLLYPIRRWFNIGLHLEYVPLTSSVINQDISDFPVYVSTGSSNELIQKRILIKSWGYTKFPPQLFTIKLKFETLISKRISFDAHIGYTIATPYQPWIYEAGGNRQWTDTGPDGGISANGTFLEYQNFNFSKFGVNGDPVKLNLTGISIFVGLSIHL